jgi:hypothetical protein
MVVVPAWISYDSSGFKRLVVIAVDLVNVISDESICTIMENKVGCCAISMTSYSCSGVSDAIRFNPSHTFWSSAW